MRKLFCCYNIEKRNYLFQRGIKYDLCALNPNTNNMFWAYIRNEKLDKVLNEWSNEKNH